VLLPVAAGWDAHVHVFDALAPVLPGHYRPVHRPLADIEALAAGHQVGHLVLVQPSVYGTDNSVLLQALRQQPGRHRGVVVVDADVSDSALDDMHALGVRGIRFNLVSPVGNAGGEARSFAALAPRLRARGWHVQWYAGPADLVQIARLHEGSGLTCVLDHLAGLHTGLAGDDPAWSALQTLSAQGAWVKLSGWYRLQAVAPWTPLDDSIRRVAAQFEGRMVWASDWPHTAFAPDQLPHYASLLQPVLRVLTPAQAVDAMGPGASRLYG
jgi:predicted TIM-barrel fold metal-dependent hydrolase